MGAITTGDILINALTNGAITSVDQLVSKRTGGSNGNPQRNWRHWEPRVAGAAMTATVSDQWESLWTYDSLPRGAGSIPTTWANPTSALAGSLGQNDASGGRQLYIAGISALLAGTPGTFLVYDRLGHMGGLTGNVTGDQQCNGGSAGTITRYTNGVGNFLAAEIYTGVGGTGEVLTATYANDSGSTSTGDVRQFGGAGLQEQGRLLFIPLAGGEKGVQSVTKINLNGSTGVAGSWGMTIGHPLYAIAIGATNFATCTSFVDGPISQVLASACLAVAYLPSLSASPIAEIEWELVEA